MRVKTIGIIGYGHFGKFLAQLAERFVPGVQIKIFSRRFPPDGLPAASSEAAQAGEQFFTLTETAASDMVILCGSISEFEAQLEEVLPYTRNDTVIVDIATVKKHPLGVLRRAAPDRQWISTHPMFGPESYEKQGGELSGLRIVVTEHTIPEERYAAAKEFISSLGFVLIEMSADEHDKLLAETLFLTHYIGQSMKEGGFLRTNMDTVSFSYLMDAVESVMHDKKLFEDVYRYNPYCKEVAERFHEAQKRVLKRLPDQSISA